jgi:hypothetical protein
MWKQLPGLANMSQEIEVFGDEPGILTLTIFAMLFNASRVRKRILEVFVSSQFPAFLPTHWSSFCPSSKSYREDRSTEDL